MPIIETAACMICGRSSEVTLTDAEFAALGTTHIQAALPDRTADERELLISGTHPACWNIAFADDEED